MDFIAQFIGLLIFLIIALAYSIVYAIIANYSVNYIFKKNKSKKPKLLNLLFFFIIIFSLITFFKFYRKTSYGDFNERFIPISKGYRLENNEVNMTYYYPNTNKEDFNNGDGIFLNKFDKLISPSFSIKSPIFNSSSLLYPYGVAILWLAVHSSELLVVLSL